MEHRIISQRRWAVLVAAAACVALPALGADGSRGGVQAGKGRPKIDLRANPPVGFPPFKVTVAAELVGGADDFADYYCAKVEWDWADGTTSESSDDCDPYQPGKSEIRRHFAQQHTYQTDGVFELEFRLKQGKKTVASAKTKVQSRGEAAFGDRFTPGPSRVLEPDHR